jgi:hypothetical protein
MILVVALVSASGRSQGYNYNYLLGDDAAPFPRKHFSPRAKSKLTVQILMFLAYHVKWPS